MLSLSRLEGSSNKLDYPASETPYLHGAAMLIKRDVIDKYGPWGLFIFVAIPLPGTGAWTGSLIAAMLDIPLKKAFPAVALGVVAAGIIVAFVSYGAAALIF